MLSRFASNLTSKTSPVALIKRLNSSEVTTLSVGTKTPRGETIVDWETFKMPNAPYDGMGPIPIKPMWNPKQIRHYIVPEYWFDFLYPRTGLSGLYMLGFGVSTFCISKEWYICANEAVSMPANLAIVIYFGLKYLGPMLRDMYYNHEDSIYAETFALKTNEIEKYNSLIDTIKTDQWRAELQDMFNDAKAVNLNLMLETENLKRKINVASAVKSKLDYQVAVEKLDKELEQDHMVKWIEDKVMSQITPQSQKLALDACIAQLNTIGKN